jgi:enoyl-[acyl-carrier protein] reductase III
MPSLSAIVSACCPYIQLQDEALSQDIFVLHQVRILCERVHPTTTDTRFGSVIHAPVAHPVPHEKAFDADVGLIRNLKRLFRNRLLRYRFSARCPIMGHSASWRITVVENKPSKWALILGASSGFGAASSLALARHGFDILGVHLDRRTTVANAERIAEEIRMTGQQALFFNVNAADPVRRSEVIQAFQEFASPAPGFNGIRTMLHSLAFGTLKSYIAEDFAKSIKPADMTMTLDVMAHSLVYWVQDLFAAGLLLQGAKVFAMTSAGGHRVWPTYGAVSAAKAALEAHVRQLAAELAPFGISANALQAGVTDTPAARRIPGSESMFTRALESNPGKRLTTPEDLAETLVSLCLCASNWATGNVIKVDGGEDLV